MLIYRIEASIIEINAYNCCPEKLIVLSYKETNLRLLRRANKIIMC